MEKNEQNIETLFVLWYNRYESNKSITEQNYDWEYIGCKNYFIV